jgi:predicted lipoprotein
MTPVLVGHVRAALGELSDEQYQSRVWTGHAAGDAMSSFVECVERLFDDSGLDDALEAGKRVFGSPIDEQLSALGDLVAKIDGSQAPDEIIAHPRMQLVRDRAAAIAQAIDEGDSGAG